MFSFFLEFGTLGVFLALALGFLLLLGGGELLVRGASGIAAMMRIPPLVIGLTVVAFATSAPEFAVSIAAALSEKPSFIVGNIVGSGICNILLILGVTALICPIQVKSRLIRVEIPIMIAVTILVFLFAFAGSEAREFSDLIEKNIVGHIRQMAGAVLVLGLIIYVLWTLYETLLYRNENTALTDEMIEHVDVLAHVSVNKSVTSETVTTDVAAEVATEKFSWHMLFYYLCTIIAGMGLLIWGSDLLVRSGTELARSLGISELVIALTLLAVGTSLPELAVSIMSAMRGRIDLAVGNVVGSNIFNILGVLGISTCISRGGIQVDSQAMLFDLPILIITSIFCLVIAWTGHKISRGEGMFLLSCYVFYVAFLVFA